MIVAADETLYIVKNTTLYYLKKTIEYYQKHYKHVMNFRDYCRLNNITDIKEVKPDIVI